jgi:quercetin dioxygenase-like cupin family protein
MIRAGFVIESPRTQSRTTIIQSDAETNGMGWVLEVVCAPNTPPDIEEHLHLTWTETFEIIAGTAYYKLDGEQKRLEAGGSFVVPPNSKHIHPWNAGDVPMVYRQTNQFPSPSPAAVQEVLGVFATVAELTRQGKVDLQTGRPKNVWQLMATLRTLAKHGGYDVQLPIPVQNVLAATLGRLAEAMGYRGVYPEYLQ